MKEKKKVQIEIIQEANAAVFEQKVNKRLSEIDHVIESGFLDSDSFCFMVKYEIIEHIPEDAADRFYQLYNKGYRCNDCPFLELDPDRRSITHWCKLHEDRVRLKDSCCDDFYSGLLDGTYHLVKPEERKNQFEQMDRYERDRRKELARINEKISRAKRTAAKCEKEASIKQPRYCFEWVGDRMPDYLNGQYMTAEEISMALYGKMQNLSEARLIDIAKDTNAAVLWKTPSLFDTASYCIYDNKAFK